MITADLYLVMGLIVVVFAVPAAVAAWSDGRAPRVASIAVLIGGALVVYAMRLKPGGYTITAIPEAFVRVLGAFLN